MRRSIPLLALIALPLGGCLGSAPPVPRDHFYRVIVSAPARSEIPVLHGVLAVAPLEADGLLRERALLYSATGQSYEMQQHDYHYWIDPPPRMLQNQLIDFMRSSGMAAAVVAPDLRVKADYNLSGRVKRLERLLGGGPPRVVAELELALVETASNNLILVRSYTAEVPSNDESVAASISALNVALAQIFESFLSDASWSTTAEVPLGRR
ncbi:MAG TPA: ABC-type transport auxiliary lipoprotein family protein [Kiloniellales bacterium]|jgi:ABC-type uncharacterized transport system auxiliary subunit